MTLNSILVTSNKVQSLAEREIQMFLNSFHIFHEFGYVTIVDIRILQCAIVFISHGQLPKTQVKGLCAPGRLYFSRSFVK